MVPESPVTPDSSTAVPATCHAQAESGWLRASVLVAAAWALGMSVQIHEGYFNPRAIGFLATGIGIALLSVVVPEGSRRWRPLLNLVFAAAIGIQFYFLMTEYIGSLVVSEPDSERRRMFNTVPRPSTSFLTPPIFRWGLVIAAVSSLFLFARRAAVVRTAFLVALATYFAMSVGFITHTNPPFSDVWMVQQRGVEALLSGKNPFTIAIPNLFDVKPGILPIDDNGDVACGYSYTPLPLFAVIPSYLLFGDVRYTHALAFAVAGALLGFMTPGRYSKLAAILVLYSPRAFTMPEIGFTEAFVMLFFMATLFATVRHRREAPVLFGLCLAAKQYTIFLGPLGLLLVPPPQTWKRSIRYLAIAFVTLSLVTIPLVVINWPESKWAMLDVQVKYNPLSQWVLTLPAWAMWHYPDSAGKLVPLAFILAAGVSLFAGLRLQRTPTNFCHAAAIAYLLFFAFNKQAYAQYYYFVISMLAATVALKLADANPLPGDHQNSAAERPAVSRGEA